MARPLPAYPRPLARPLRSLRPPRARFGDQRVCATCGLDIEFHGSQEGWVDRGGNHHCDTGGGAKYDQDGCPVKLPHRKHSLQPATSRPATSRPATSRGGAS